MFQCKNDKCVPYWWFVISSINCIKIEKKNFFLNEIEFFVFRKCDGVNDCGDSSDEIGCTNSTNTPTSNPIDIDPSDSEICLRNQFMCDLGRCISKSYVCDGFPDCSTGEDEINCPKNVCGRDKFR